ncbi:MAG: hypothetical protein IPI48_04410 [bacterium]|nr:hypothetical protein [bacterium]
MYRPDDTDSAEAARGHEVTLALQAARRGDPLALNDAFQLVYEEVRAIARSRVARAGGRATLDTTAVVHEAYLKLARHGEMAWEDRQHFLAVASTAMRQVLLDHARRHLSVRRGGGAPHVPLTEADVAWRHRRAMCWRSTLRSATWRAWTRSWPGWSSCATSAGSRSRRRRWRSG